MKIIPKAQQLHDFCQYGRKVIDIERNAIANLASTLDENFAQACETLLQCRGRVIVIGMGKSGHIAKKIAATFASTGTPAFYVHPSEASHGDMGMITPDDTVLAISYSGETAELISILPLARQLNIPLIAICGRNNSTLSKMSDITLDVRVSQEACTLGLAPTASTTATLVMGDALAIALLEARGFTREDFARFHPGGSLGRQLLVAVKELMHSGDDMPCVKHHCTIADALIEMTQKSLGMTLVINQDNQLQGIFTDGDLRRAIDNQHDIHQTPISTAMTARCMSISPEMLATEALKLMRDHKITSLPVTHPQSQYPLGVIHMHDILRAGVL